jgi:hypothetical protein
MENKLIKEMIYRKILWTAKKNSYHNPKKNKMIDHEANNAFGRLIIGLLTFILKQHEPIIIIDKKNPKVMKFIKKWEAELKEKQIILNTNKMINILNTYVPKPEYIIVPELDIKALIPEKTYDRMLYRYQSQGNKPENFHLACKLVYLRYNTYDAWSQCWTMCDEDRINFANPKWKTIELFGSAFNTQKDTYLFGSLFPDVDGPFGGVSRYIDLYQRILDDNLNGTYYNIWVDPPNLETILEDLIPRISNLKKNNNVFCMFPTWKDSIAYLSLEKMFNGIMLLGCHQDMWTGKKMYPGKSTIFYDTTIKF